MPKILLLTCDELPNHDVETVLVAAALTDRGMAAPVVSWSDPDLGQLGGDLAIIRSTWDYTTRLTEFVSVLERLPMPVANPVPVVRWNSHKGYLTELARAGIPVVPTVLVSRGSAQLLPDIDAAEVIIKPAVSAGGRGVGRFSAGSDEAAAHLATLVPTADVLIQPFVPEVADGERSLIYLGGVYSHAVRKMPADDEFRVQERYGGVTRPHIASGAEIEAAEAAIAAVPGGEPLLYARVDLVGSGADPLVMELELIEPDLFLPHAPGAVERLAAAIIALL